ncbi:MAG: retropepsin-like domain-containing protein, partial [Acidobacteriota bacterium]|nr:retropepsin-like domain-containing protein [Acidobacteriota bacterium]
MITKYSDSSKTITKRKSISKYLPIILVFVFSSSLFAKPISIPFELYNNHIYLKTQVNGKGTYYFLFDSGAGSSGSIIDGSVAETLNLPVKGYVNANLVGGSKGIAYTEDVKFSVRELIFDEKKAAFLPLKEQEKEEGHQVDGIFGYSLIKSYVIEVDYPRRIITFYNLEEYRKPKNAKVIRLLNINENKVPVIQGEILTAGKKKINFMLTVDTGYDGNFLLGRKFVEENK